ncbi:hypothetical protein JB92DRAFT_2826712 [Gautieria morchelliformis]|nr:hypothetical protein JB92DRAFT_2826712 [Gautieria morchelliformis]
MHDHKRRDKCIAGREASNRFSVRAWREVEGQREREGKRATWATNARWGQTPGCWLTIRPEALQVNEKNRYARVPGIVVLGVITYHWSITPLADHITCRTDDETYSNWQWNDNQRRAGRTTVVTRALPDRLRPALWLYMGSALDCKDKADRS